MRGDQRQYQWRVGEAGEANTDQSGAQTGKNRSPVRDVLGPHDGSHDQPLRCSFGEGWGRRNPLKSGNNRTQVSRLTNPVVTRSGNNGPLRPSRTVDARGVASGRGIVDVQIDRSRIGEEPLDGSLHLTPVDQLPTDHYCI